MSNDSEKGVTPILAFLGGGLVIAVVVLGVFVAEGRQANRTAAHPQSVSLNFKMPLRR